MSSFFTKEVLFWAVSCKMAEKKGKGLPLTLSVSLSLASSPKGGANASPRPAEAGSGRAIASPSGEVALRSNDGEGLQQPLPHSEKRVRGSGDDSQTASDGMVFLEELLKVGALDLLEHFLEGHPLDEGRSISVIFLPSRSLTLHRSGCGDRRCCPRPRARRGRC